MFDWLQTIWYGPDITKEFEVGCTTVTLDFQDGREVKLDFVGKIRNGFPLGGCPEVEIITSEDVARAAIRDWGQTNLIPRKGEFSFTSTGHRVTDRPPTWFPLRQVREIRMTTKPHTIKARRTKGVWKQIED
jgi:hypothetical protein